MTARKRKTRDHSVRLMLRAERKAHEATSERLSGALTALEAARGRILVLEGRVEALKAEKRAMAVRQLKREPC